MGLVTCFENCLLSKTMCIPNRDVFERIHSPGSPLCPLLPRFPGGPRMKKRKEKKKISLECFSCLITIKSSDIHSFCCRLCQMLNKNYSKCVQTEVCSKNVFGLVLFWVI